MKHLKLARELLTKIPTTQDAHWWADRLISEAFDTVEREALERAARFFEDESCSRHEADGVCIATRIRALYPTIQVTQEPAQAGTGARDLGATAPGESDKLVSREAVDPSLSQTSKDYPFSCEKCGASWRGGANFTACPRCLAPWAETTQTDRQLTDLHEIAVKEAAKDRRGGTSTGDWSPLSREDLDRCVDLAFIRGFKRGVAVNDNAHAVIDALAKVTPASTYPCIKCGKLRTKEEGGTTFTGCDTCWDKKESRPVGEGGDNG